jgi:hypothetical protein
MAEKTLMQTVMDIGMFSRHAVTLSFLIIFVRKQIIFSIF